ncbi:restriction endonuclease subunit S [Clostridium sp. JNZ X4-2]
MDKNKANVPKIRFPGFTDPWEQRKLREISKLSSSKRVHREDYVETGIPFFRGLEISKLGSSSKLEDLLYISEEYYKNLKDKYGVPQIGDILITAVGTLGNSYLIRDNTPFYFKDGNLIWLSDIKINSQYLNTYLGDGIGKKRVLESAAGSNQKALTMVKLQNVQVLFPSKEEQRKIEIFFQNLDNLITLHQRKLNHLKDEKKGLLQKMFPKKGENFPELRFLGFTDPWEQRKLGDVVERVTRKNKDLESTLPLTISAQDGLVDQNVFFNKTVASRDVSGYYLVKNGEFAYNKSYSNGYPWGAVKRLERYDMGVLSTLYIVFKPTDVNSDFLTKYYDTTYWYHEISKHAAEGARNHGLLNIAVSDFFETELTIPKDKAEQEKIGRFFNNIDNLITLHQRKLNHLKKQKKALLQQMFI